MPTLVDLVVVDELGIGLLGPGPRRLILLAGKDAHGHPNGDALGVDSATLIVASCTPATDLRRSPCRATGSPVPRRRGSARSSSGMSNPKGAYCGFDLFQLRFLSESCALPLLRHLAQRAERCPDLWREELRLLPGGEVAALVDLVEVGEVGVGLLDPAARGPEDLAGERGEADRDRDRRRSLAGRAQPVACPLSQYDRAAEAPVPVSQ